MVNPRENEDELTMLRKAFEDMKNDEEEFLHPMQKYEIRFSTSKPRRKFILTVRTSVRLELMTDTVIRTILQEWIDRSFETPYKVREVISVENL